MSSSHEEKKPYFNSWQWTIIIVTTILAVVFVWANIHPYTLHFDFTMDDNTLSAVKEINWTTVMSK